MALILCAVPLCRAQGNRVMLLDEEWDTYTQTSNREVNGWKFCKSGINDESIVQRANLHAYLSTGYTEGSGTVVATPWLAQVADTFSFRIYGSNLQGQTALVEFGFIPDSATINNPSDICALFIPYDTVALSVSNQWQRTTRDMHPYYAIHGTTHRFAIRLINNYHQELYLDELRAWIPADEHTTTCPDLTTKGRDFWMMFLYNQNINPGTFTTQHTLTAISDQNCTVNFEVFSNGSTSQSNLQSGSDFCVDKVVPNLSLTVGTVYNGGIHVTSDEDIWLYARNLVTNTQDIATILPTSVLDTTYIVQDYPSTNYGGEVGFVATENGTVLTMTVPCDIEGTSITAGTTLTVNLNRGQTYLLLAANGAERTFSGMRVTSNGKPFAAFHGGWNPAVPSNGSGRDHCYEQVSPMGLWGTEFVVAGTKAQTGNNRIRITTEQGGCDVNINGSHMCTLNAQSSYEYTMPTTANCHIVTSKPVSVLLYMGSYSNTGHIGDPSTATIVPVERGICNSRFKVLNSSKIIQGQHYLIVICPSGYDSSMRLDGTALPATGVSTRDNYTLHHLTVTPGTHTLANSNGPFVAYAYGAGDWESYAYPLDFKVEPVPVDTTEPYVPEIHRDTVWLMDTVCQGQPYNGFGFTVVATQTANPGNLSLTSVSRENDTLLHYHILTLTIMPTYDTSVLLFLIPGDTVFFLGDTLTEACQRSYTLQTLYGCDSLVNLTLNYAEVSLISSSQGGCPGSEVTLTADGTRLFYWSSTPYDPELDSQQGQNPITVHPTVTTVYQLLDASGNVISSVTVGVEPPPTLCVELGRDFIDFDHPVITLHDCSPDRHHSTWVFSDGYTMHGERIRRQFRHPLPDTVTVTLHSCNQYECCADTTIGFHPEIRSIWFPNIFTPNEPQNNRFGPVTSCQVADFEIYIYNRWGLLVFHSTDIQAPWDGTHDGTPVPQGAYAYQWYLKDIHGDRWNGTGTVTLIR